MKNTKHRHRQQHHLDGLDDQQHQDQVPPLEARTPAAYVLRVDRRVVDHLAARVLERRAGAGTDDERRRRRRRRRGRPPRAAAPSGSRTASPSMSSTVNHSEPNGQVARHLPHLGVDEEEGHEDQQQRQRPRRHRHQVAAGCRGYATAPSRRSAGRAARSRRTRAARASMTESQSAGPGRVLARRPSRAAPRRRRRPAAATTTSGTSRRGRRPARAAARSSATK